MCYFDKNLYEKAMELFNKAKDLADIAKDVWEINDVVENPLSYTPQQMRELDKYIRGEYPEIDGFQKLAESIKWKQVVGSGRQQVTIQEIERLKFDCYYLLALALKRSGEIVELSDFFDKSHIDND